MMIRRLIALSIVVAILIIVGAGINALLYGSVRITIEGNHSPVSSSVKSGEQRLFPQGEGGREYVLRKRQGDYTVIVSGPEVKRTELRVSVRMLSQGSEKVTVEQRTEQSIAGDVIKPAQGTRIISSRFFGRNDWLVARTDDQNPINDTVTHVLVYSYDDDTWVPLVSGVKIVTNEPNLRDAPLDMIQYLGTVGGD